jgi:hypothetical protein
MNMPYRYRCEGCHAVLWCLVRLEDLPGAGDGFTHLRPDDAVLCGPVVAADAVAAS